MLQLRLDLRLQLSAVWWPPNLAAGRNVPSLRPWFCAFRARAALENLWRHLLSGRRGAALFLRTRRGAFGSVPAGGGLAALFLRPCRSVHSSSAISPSPLPPTERPKWMGTLFTFSAMARGPVQDASRHPFLFPAGVGASGQANGALRRTTEARRAGHRQSCGKRAACCLRAALL